MVGEFVQSCHKYGIKPGLYYSLGGRYLTDLCTREDGTLDRPKLNDLLLRQLEELITNYGPLFETGLTAAFFVRKRAARIFPAC